MGSSTNRKAAKHFGAIIEFSRTITVSFGAIGSGFGSDSLIFGSVRRLTGS